MAIVLDIPLVDRLDKNPCEVIETGDYVRVDGAKGVVEVTKKK
jgi:predicted aconitase with swiveling domain